MSHPNPTTATTPDPVLALSDQEFVETFENGSFPPGQFHHEDHVRLAWLYLREGSSEEALHRFVTVLRDFVTRHGAEDKYHETITWAYLLLINERIHQGEPTSSWAEFRRAHPDLLHWSPSILERYYRRETLESSLARKVFLMPDRLGN